MLKRNFRKTVRRNYFDLSVFVIASVCIGLFIYCSVFAITPETTNSSNNQDIYKIWDPAAEWPQADKRIRPEKAVDILVHRACEEYRFLHDNAVVWHGDTLFAAWYNCPEAEIVDESLIRGRRSNDGGKTWSDIEVIAADYKGKGIHYVPVAFLSHDDNLYAFITNMVGHDLVTHCEVFVLDENTDEWKSLGFIADQFLPNCTPIKMDDGNFIMAGRVAQEPKTRPEWPAVAISDGDNITEPWTIVRLMDDRLLRFPETTVWVQGSDITAISRSLPNECPAAGRVFTSTDYGRSWHGPMCHNLPEIRQSKLYAGLLSTGQRYLVWTVPPGREELVIGVSRPGEKKLAAVWQLQRGFSEDLGVGPQWSYPYAVEHDGKLYVIYTSQKNHSVMTIVPIGSLIIE